MGKRQHFVPRFYLSAFASSERRIHVFNLRRREAFLGVSLRDQCYAHRLYGADEVVEKALAQLEGLAAPVFKAMRNREVVPGGGTPERDVFMAFLGFQLGRTTAAQANALAASRLLTRVAFDGAPPSEFETSADDAVKMTLAVAPEMAATVRDLSITLIRAEGALSFVTSDNPVVKYNSYCEGITDFGVTGTKSLGLQLFLPVSPRLVAYLFDGATYKLLRPRGRLVSATADDVNAINRLQLVNARDNVYFAAAELASSLAQAAPAIEPIRENNKPRITEAAEEGNENSRLLHQFWPMPQLGLRLSFVAIRPKAERLPLFERPRQSRSPYAITSHQKEAPGMARRFKVVAHH